MRQSAPGVALAVDELGQHAPEQPVARCVVGHLQQRPRRIERNDVAAPAPVREEVAHRDSERCIGALGAAC
jgi:hypothetical protein